MYTKSQDLLQSRPTAMHAGDVAFTLSKDRLSNPLQDQDDIMVYVRNYVGFGYFLFIAWVMHIGVSKNMKHLKSISSTIKEHIDLIISTVFIGYIFVICEFIAITVYFRDLFFSELHMFLWIPSLY
jgi:hypothetical protein